MEKEITEIKQLLQSMDKRMAEIEKQTAANTKVATTMVDYVWILDSVSSAVKWVDPRKLVGGTAKPLKTLECNGV